MSTQGISYHVQRSTAEGRYVIDCTNSLLDGVTISSATATHSNMPTGAALTITTNVATPLVYVNVPIGLTMWAEHFVDVVMPTSDSALTIVHRLVIKCEA